MTRRSTGTCRRPLLALLLALALPAVSFSQATLFFDGFAPGNANGWTLGTEWQIATPLVSIPTPGCGLSGDPPIDGMSLSMGGIAGVVIGGNGTTAVHPAYYLTSPVIPLSGGGPYTLRFSRWLNTDAQPKVVTTVEAAFGAGWFTIWSNPNTCHAESSWSTQTVDVTPFDQGGWVQIRFGVAVNQPGSIPSASWNIDNFSISATPFERIVNGSFEATYPGTNAAGLISQVTALQCRGWTVTGGNIDAVNAATWNPSRGARSIDLNGLTAGTLQTGTKLASYRNYALTFDYTANPAAASASMNVTVTFAPGSGVAPVTGTFTATNAGSTPANMAWKRGSLFFSTDTATIATFIATIAFASTTAGASGMALDNVRLVRGEEVVNGSFEYIDGAPPGGVATLSAGSEYVWDWNVGPGSVDLVQNWQAADYISSVDLSGQAAGEIATRVLLLRDRTYTFEFDLAGNPLPGAPALKSLQVSGEFEDPGIPTQSQNYTFDSTGLTTANMGWVTRTFVLSTTGAATPWVVMNLKFKSLTPGLYGPVIDDVRLLASTSGSGQANSAAASLRVNGVGNSTAAGPWGVSINDASGLNLSWSGPSFAPYILAVSPVGTNHTPLLCMGLLDLGTAPSFSDVFILLDGTQFPGSLLYNLNASGAATNAFNVSGIPSGTALSLQGLIGQPAGAPCPFVLTAAHRISKY